MMIKIQDESELLDPLKRKKLIDHWEERGNGFRKHEAFKAYECLKDKTVNYVFDLLLHQFDITTVLEMQYAMSNISILRKVIDKLARVYSNGVKRTMKNKKATAQVEAIADALLLNEVMKKVNKYFRTFKNCLLYVKPQPDEDGPKYSVQLEVLPPFHYDVVESPKNPTKPMAVVLSDYTPTRRELYVIGNAATANRQGSLIRDPMELPTGDRPLELNLDGQGKPKKTYIWWTKSYHFTTDEKGQIVKTDPESDIGDVSNPIGALPFVNFCGEQDGRFFAEGGADLVDAGIKVNTMITNVQHVAISQGYGQLYMTGKNLPKSVKVGPNHCVQLAQEEGEPTPTVGYLNSNPPIDELKGLIEMYVALMLSTNNLSTTGFAMSLSTASSKVASGIALMIDKSESVEDVQEQSQIFIKREPEAWVLIEKWLAVYKASGLLNDDFAGLDVPKDVAKVQLKFEMPVPITSEVDELTALKLRQDLGIDTMVDLIMRDDPSLTEEEAQAKLLKITEEKMQRMADAVTAGLGNAGGADGVQGQEGGGKPGPNGVGNQPNGGPPGAGGSPVQNKA